MLEVARKTIYTLSNFVISDEIELNYLIKNTNNLIDVARKLMREEHNKIYKDNYMEYTIAKKDGNKRPLIIESAINELISGSIINSIGLCIDNIQDEDISFGNRLEINGKKPYVMRYFMEQYYKKFIYNQKLIKENDEYRYYIKLDLKEYYKNINHNRLIQILDNYLSKNTWFENAEWFKSIINNYISRQLIENNEGYGIAQGLPLSGLLANIYLNDYDQWFKQTYNNKKIYRYVDDIIIFSNENLNKKQYISFITSELKLKLNAEKTEEDIVNNWKL